jgi:hypothetical protein
MKLGGASQHWTRNRSRIVVKSAGSLKGRSKKRSKFRRRHDRCEAGVEQSQIPPRISLICQSAAQNPAHFQTIPR